MNVAWGLFCGESQGKKPCVFPCKVAAAGDERCLVCAAGAAWIVSARNRSLCCVLQRVVVHLRVILFVCGLSCCRSQCNGCMNVAWALIWGESRSTKPCVYPCKAAAAGDERYPVCAAGAAWIVSTHNLFLLCVLQRRVVHVCVIPCVC